MAPRAADQDPLIAALVRAERARRPTEPLLQDILAQIAPRLERFRDRAIERGMLASTDAADLVNEVYLRLLVKLRQVSRDPDSQPIWNLDDYVGSVFRHALDDLGRMADPVLARLTLRIRYVLTHTRPLAVWGKDPVLCGNEAWRDVISWVPPPSLQGLPPADTDARALRRVVIEIVRRAGAPLRLDSLIQSVAQLSGSEGHQFVALASVQREPDLAAHPNDMLANRQYLEQVWRELEQLPLRQRRAMLLNVRLDSGDSIVRALVAVRIVGLRRVAEVLEMPVEELLASWERLPLSDAELSERLELTQQQVVNLRKAARDRLARRTGRPRAGAST